MTREEAITVLKDISWQMGSVKRWENIEATDMAIEALKNRPTGEWIKHENPKGVFSRECSECKCWFPWDMPRNSFCPNCGADMRGEK